VTLCRKSGGYDRGCFLAIGGPFSAKRKVSTKAGQLQFFPWTFFGNPSIALPIADDPETKMPLAMQIVAPCGCDGGC
jgi:Asp-tRNA(Asn)/Glu-tRNA(Gln) amidotransferase A subunit family amidase